MGQFDLNSKDISFMVDAIGGILAENQPRVREIKDLDSFNSMNEEIFVQLRDKMFQSWDSSIKVDLATKLMFGGYNKFNEGISAAMGSVSKIFGEKK